MRNPYFYKNFMIMETASFAGVIKTICTLIIIYYALVLLMRLLAPVLVQQVVKKATQNFTRQSGQQQQQYTQQQNFKEQYKAPKQQNANPKSKKQVGEYIDFEELD